MHNIHNCKIRASGEVRAKMAEKRCRLNACGRPASRIQNSEYKRSEMLQPRCALLFSLDGTSQQVSTKLWISPTHSREWQILLWGENVEVKMMGPCCAKICITDRWIFLITEPPIPLYELELVEGYIWPKHIGSSPILSWSHKKAATGKPWKSFQDVTKHPARPPAHGRRKEL